MIHNAIRFAPEGRSIPVTAQLATSGVEVHIDDEGPGIAEGNQRIIFERFSRLSADQTGASLGLAITKWIVEEHGGEIFVSGNPLGGSRFTVLLPKESATCASESNLYERAKGKKWSRPILRVSSRDSDRCFRASLANWLHELKRSLCRKRHEGRSFQR